MALLAYVRRRLVFKIGFVTLFAIAFGFIGYAVWNSRQASKALEDETRDSSRRLAQSLIAGIETTMVAGNGILVAEYIHGAKTLLPSVTIHVYDPDGAPVFEPRGPAPPREALPAPVRHALADARRSEEAGLVHLPVPNEHRCHECHDPTATLRGVLALELDHARATAGRDEVLGVVLTDAFVQVMSADKTELMDDYFTELRARVPSITDVAVYDAEGSLTFGRQPAGAEDQWTALLADATRPGAAARTVEVGGAQARIVPMPLEQRCEPCHDDGAPVRGALVVAFTSTVPAAEARELEGVIDTSLRTIMMSALGRLIVRFLTTVESTGATEQLRLYDAEGRLYFDADAVPRPPPAVATALATGRSTVSDDPGDALTVVVPLANEERCQSCHGDDRPIRGAIEIVTATDRAAAARRDAVTNALRFAGITIVLVSVLLWLALKWIVVDPVRHLGSVAEQIGAGNLAVADVRGANPGGDEVARLGSRMNEMVRGLRAKLHLEKFVSRGTAQAAAGAAGCADAMTREGVRRVCTVLFTDIRGFTAYSERVEPERVVRMLNRILAAQAAVVESFDGDIDKFVGDELMAVFHGDDGPARAVRCALRMVEAVAQAREGEETIAVGAGIAYGDTVYGAIGAESRMDFTVIGDVVNTGARLCSRAAPGEVLVSAAAHDQVGAAADVVFEAVEPLLLKGKRLPLATYRARSAGSAAPAPGPTS